MLDRLINLDYGKSRKIVYHDLQGKLTRLPCGCYKARVFDWSTGKWVNYYIPNASKLLLFMFLANYPNKESAVYKMVEKYVELYNWFIGGEYDCHTQKLM